ncbi:MULTISPECIES: pyridoxine 5'-phosphate synthase [Ectothiorhodospira]|uniref:Pyridoxine 5'-phosphate synthase n=1 Tax=Ectothiorhodospira marina TaxID=1396821 RepID=A0A1H7KLJ0_9GAMM|nr:MULTISPECIES: pyridoxine 5'-phosphate synthase [Ectothiorhodospira]MCG5515256.1 pyridoxine 5'-phosphate synthase [Ectothiorhodospira sp. 9100]MCG5517895.1 pyridoxine 5'-phosphate synthase [Ectothiorhodospira sp. 9905]SEK87701.1 pyridoxine 5-phosphate synthase [Ectothiorhodospira marina]
MSFVFPRLRLGVNIDHLATIRQVRHTAYPDLEDAVRRIEAAGADIITLHLREDRRHIQDADVYGLRRTIQSGMNLEMAPTAEMHAIALEVKPEACCLVPERREELTTEGGLDVLGHEERLADYCAGLVEAGIKVSLFVEPDPQHLDAAHRIGAPVVELHTGAYANASTPEERNILLEQIGRAARYGHELGLVVSAGHGLDYDNVGPIAAIPEFFELNIGHSIVARALFCGVQQAVAEMRSAMDTAR